jgi:hypothetical protein
METMMAASQEDWIKHRAYELWEQEGYPSGKDTEHWERAKLEYATLKPTASNGTGTKVSAKAPKPAAPKATAKPAAKKVEKPAVKAEPAPTKAPAAAAKVKTDQTKKRPKKVAAE